MISRMFVSSVVSATVYKMLELCVDYPHNCEDESVASKILNLLNTRDEISYGEFREEALRNPELISVKIQNAVEMASAAASFSGK
jgi:tRNA A37 N6-isopentenylltransferase MiaA